VKGKRVAKGQMSRSLVRLCMAMLTAAAVWGAVMKSIRPDADMTDVLSYVGAAFGGELLLLMGKRILAKERKENEEDCPEDGEPE
jgi:NADH:ubiquinone oxidoreductase subunit 6 (subunit J)